MIKPTHPTISMPSNIYGTKYINPTITRQTANTAKNAVQRFKSPPQKYKSSFINV